MSAKENQVTQWLKKLEQESWQLELLVSAFTIFLLIQANISFTDYFNGIEFRYNINDGIVTFIYLFVALLGISIRVLTFFLIVHLMLRGFWIGAIGLRSVQSTIDFSRLNYSDFFSEKLRKRVISLDNLVTILDEICSVIFSFSFLIISMLLAFGLWLLFMGLTTFMLLSLAQFTDGILSDIFSLTAFVLLLVILITGILYLIDYFTLGILKKNRIIGKIYYPIYRFYGFITLSAISRSIYYYLISKFTKRRIRLVYVLVGLLIMGDWLVEFDQYQYYPDSRSALVLNRNYYDDLRSESDYVTRASIPSKVITEPYLELFLRYDPQDNELIGLSCPDFEPMKNDGINPSLSFRLDGGTLNISDMSYEEEDQEMLMECLSSIYEVAINDSVYAELNYYFFEHPSKGQLGQIAMIDTKHLMEGENIIRIQKAENETDSTLTLEDYAHIPFWVTR